MGDEPENSWYSYQERYPSQAIITDSQYIRSDFRIKFEGSSTDNNENLWIDDVLITGSVVSGGAGYVKQSFAGDSGTSTFSLSAFSEAQMLTIAIAPDISKGEVCSDGEIRP